MPYVAWTDKSNGEFEIYVLRWDGSNWVEVGTGSASGGGISNNHFNSVSPSLAISPDGLPYVAWADDSNADEDFEIYLRKWDGSSWVEVGAGSASGGGITDNGNPSFDPSLAIAPDGVPYVAWVEFSQIDNIYVRKWNGSSWVEVGSGSASGGGISNHPGGSMFYGGSYHPSLAISPEGVPYVAWYHSNHQSDPWVDDIYVRQWNGSRWVEAGTGSASGGGVSNNAGVSESPSLAISLDGVPYVAWADISGGEAFQIFIRQWDGSGWVEVGAGSAGAGGISNNGGRSKVPSLAISPNGVPHIAWDDFNSAADNIYIRQWDGSSWVEVSAGSASGAGIHIGVGPSISPSLAISPEGVLYVAYVSENAEIYVLFFET